jgi:hypothetical protein
MHQDLLQSEYFMKIIAHAATNISEDNLTELIENILVWKYIYTCK